MVSGVDGCRSVHVARSLIGAEGWKSDGLGRFAKWAQVYFYFTLQLGSFLNLHLWKDAYLTDHLGCIGSGTFSLNTTQPLRTFFS